MLVIERKSRESIRIGEDICITILRTKNNRVRLGIQAPRDLKIDRVEPDQEEADESQRCG